MAVLPSLLQAGCPLPSWDKARPGHNKAAQLAWEADLRKPTRVPYLAIDREANLQLPTCFTPTLDFQVRLCSGYEPAVGSIGRKPATREHQSRLQLTLRTAEASFCHSVLTRLIVCYSHEICIQWWLDNTTHRWPMICSALRTSVRARGRPSSRTAMVRLLQQKFMGQSTRRICGSSHRILVLGASGAAGVGIGGVLRAGGRVSSTLPCSAYSPSMSDSARILNAPLS